jgi:hypothetical protein
MHARLGLGINSITFRPVEPALATNDIAFDARNSPGWAWAKRACARTGWPSHSRVCCGWRLSTLRTQRIPANTIRLVPIVPIVPRSTDWGDACTREGEARGADDTAASHLGQPSYSEYPLVIMSVASGKHAST